MDFIMGVVTGACKPCCEQDLLPAHGPPSKVRPLSFDEQWKEEVMGELESKSNSWEIGQTSWGTDFENQKTALSQAQPGFTCNSNPMFEDVGQQEHDQHQSDFDGRRPPAFDVRINREGPLWQKLGIAVAIHKTKRDCIIVQNVRDEGLVPQWNAEHASLQVRVGDLIAHVNGISGDARAMCNCITSATEGSKLYFRIVVPGQSSSQDSRQMECLSLGSSAKDTRRDQKSTLDAARDVSTTREKLDEASDVSTTSTECGSADYSRAVSPEIT